MKFVGYYTVGTGYEADANLLRKTLEALGLPHYIRPVPNLGSWQKNTQYKSRFIRDTLVTLKEPIVYLDVDAVVLKVPTKFTNLTCDIAACKWDHRELLSGTVFFNYNKRVDEVVAKWIANCDQYPVKFPPGLLPHFPRGSDAWDQRMLDLAIHQTPEAVFEELAPEYCYIAGFSHTMYPGVDPFILHLQGRARHQKSIDVEAA